MYFSHIYHFRPMTQPNPLKTQIFDPFPTQSNTTQPAGNPTRGQLWRHVLCISLRRRFVVDFLIYHILSLYNKCSCVGDRLDRCFYLYIRGAGFTRLKREIFRCKSKKLGVDSLVAVFTTHYSLSACVITSVKEVMFSPVSYLFVFWQDYSETTGRTFLKFYGVVEHNPGTKR